jgi:hypothetical protein
MISRPTHDRVIRRLRLFSGGLLTAVIVAAPGCTRPEEPSARTMVYLDSITKKPVVQEVSNEFPAVNLSTGKRTLKPAAYCDACKTWHAIPPLDQIQRRPGSLSCPKTKTPLRFDGPIGP